MATFPLDETNLGYGRPDASDVYDDWNHVQKPSANAKALAITRSPSSSITDLRYPCPHCTTYQGRNGFLLKTDLRRHIRTQHNIKAPFHCNIPGCSRIGGFSRERDLCRHHQKEHPNAPQYLEDLQSSKDPQLPRAIDMKEDVPFTDSGYRSMPNPDASSNGRAHLSKTQHPLSTDSSLPKSSQNDIGVKTTYSLETTADQSYTRKFIFELCKDIYYKSYQFVDIKNRSILSKVLPELIKAFAIKLCYDDPAQVNRDIMFFVHKRQQ
jgi:hypothetical protein